MEADSAEFAVRVDAHGFRGSRPVQMEPANDSRCIMYISQRNTRHAQDYNMQAHTRARAHKRARTHTHTCRHAHAHAQPAHTHHSLRGPKRALPKRLGACPAELTPHPQCRSHACMGSQPASQRGRAHLTGWTGMHHSGTVLWRILARRRARRLATPCASHVVRRVLCAACRRVAPAAAECVAVRDQPVPCFLRHDQIEVGRPRQDVAVAAADQTGVPRLA